jgi:hypothetical protein
MGLERKVIRVVPSQVHNLSKDELMSHIEVIQRQLKEMTDQRNDLARDVELLCLDTGSATFDRSSVLQERVRNTDIELARLREAHNLAKAERDELQDDNVHLKQAKRVSDTSCREVRSQELRTIR